MEAQVLRWWTPAQLTAMASRIAAVFEAWSADWGAPGAAAVECRAASESEAGAGAAWQPLASGAAAASQVWAAGLPEVRRLAGVLFDHRSEPAPLAMEVAGSARADLLQRLGGLAGAAAPAPLYAEAVPPHAQCRPWSGAVVAQCAGPAGTIVLHLGPLAASALAPTPARAAPVPLQPLAALTEALAERALSLRVELNPVELDVGALRALDIGDVLVLPHPLAEPLAVQVEGAAAHCAAFLGAHGGRRAIELVALRSANPSQ